MKLFRFECDGERLDLRTAVTSTEAQDPRVQAIILRFGYWGHAYVHKNFLWFKQTVINLSLVVGLEFDLQPKSNIQRDPLVRICSQFGSV